MSPAWNQNMKHLLQIAKKLRGSLPQATIYKISALQPQTLDKDKLMYEF
jgi:hypothetical protein